MSDRVFNVAAVSYLNTRPLVWGLDAQADIRLQLAVPAGLAELLSSGRADVALLPTIDYQRLENLSVVPSAGIGCDGPTLTVRIFSRVPIEQITCLSCDTESHTSVALARIIFAERYGRRPEFVDLRRGSESDHARLLIGDKVVCAEPAGFPHQYDLGAEWKNLTGLPFVFAIWTAPAGLDLCDLPQRLTDAMHEGLKQVDQIVARDAVPRGWPAGLAREYLTHYLKFPIGDPQLQAIRRFHELAARHHVIEQARPLLIYGRS